MVATPFVKRRQQEPKPRDSPDITMTLKPSLSSEWGSIDETGKRGGIVVSAGVVYRGKGIGWIAWKPGRSRSRPRESKPAIGSPVEHGPWPGRPPLTFRERERKLRETNRGG